MTVQQISPQQMGQQTSMSTPMSPQLSSGALQQINAGSNMGPGPASPQLSSQTHGSIGSITIDVVIMQVYGVSDDGEHGGQ
ncbi:hypothetical protein Taro_037795 [Colocasia esculenta]|uniref:Uncharacterized protein n=1 Tax=Colocasia esculenta TaxID=4460 RepID=A0A843WQS3_COLES|nr:hypothetical protein [Colocasia esculenta]